MREDLFKLTMRPLLFVTITASDELAYNSSPSFSIGWFKKLYFINVAMGSCAELRTQIYIAIDIEYIESSLGKV